MPGVITGETVVKAALMKAGVTGKGRQPDAFDSNNALDDLNDMIAQWNIQRYIVWGLLDKGIVSTGAASYSIGPGGDIPMTRAPRSLKAGYVRQINTSGLPVNTPLDIIPSMEQYSRISLPTLVSFPLKLFLDTTPWPLCLIRPYPLPNANIYEIHVIVQNPIVQIELATDLSVLPDYYIPAFKFNLAQILRQGYGRGGKPDIRLDQLASNSLEVLIQVNTQIAELVMPKVLISQTSGYNILSDQF